MTFGLVCLLASGYVRPTPLSRDRIVDAALKILDAEQLSAVTMRRVATELSTGRLAASSPAFPLTDSRTSCRWPGP